MIVMNPMMHDRANAYDSKPTFYSTREIWLSQNGGPACGSSYLNTFSRKYWYINEWTPITLAKEEFSLKDSNSAHFLNAEEKTVAIRQWLTFNPILKISIFDLKNISDQQQNKSKFQL